MTRPTFSRIKTSPEGKLAGVLHLKILGVRNITKKRGLRVGKTKCYARVRSGWCTKNPYGGYLPLRFSVPEHKEVLFRCQWDETSEKPLTVVDGNVSELSWENCTSSKEHSMTFVYPFPCPVDQMRALGAERLNILCNPTDKLRKEKLIVQIWQRNLSYDKLLFTGIIDATPWLTGEKAMSLNQTPSCEDLHFGATVLRLEISYQKPPRISWGLPVSTPPAVSSEERRKKAIEDTSRVHTEIPETQSALYRCNPVEVWIRKEQLSVMSKTNTIGKLWQQIWIEKIYIPVMKANIHGIFQTLLCFLLLPLCLLSCVIALPVVLTYNTFTSPRASFAFMVSSVLYILTLQIICDIFIGVKRIVIPIKETKNYNLNDEVTIITAQEVAIDDEVVEVDFGHNSIDIEKQRVTALMNALEKVNGQSSKSKSEKFMLQIPKKVVVLVGGKPSEFINGEWVESPKLQEEVETSPTSIMFMELDEFHDADIEEDRGKVTMINREKELLKQIEILQKRVAHMSDTNNDAHEVAIGIPAVHQTQEIDTEVDGSFNNEQSQTNTNETPVSSSTTSNTTNNSKSNTTSKIKAVSYSSAFAKEEKNKASAAASLAANVAVLAAFEIGLKVENVKEIITQTKLKVALIEKVIPVPNVVACSN